MKIVEPTLIINKNQVIQNIKKIQEKATKSNVRFRPHFKTHQSADVGAWFRELGVSCITVSSVRMAECFAKAGWKDITIAFPVNILEIDRINELAKKIQLNLLVESLETIMNLDEKLEQNIDVWVNIDTGYHRAGIEWNKTDKILESIEQIQNMNQIKLAGFLTHSGHSYKARSKAEILAIYADTIEKMTDLKRNITAKGYRDLLISVGDTPTASIVDDFTAVDEIRPGNFAFYDLTQVQIGSCSEEEIAVRLACPVVAKYDERSEILITGGAIYLSKESLIDENGKTIFGYVSQTYNEEYTKAENVYVSSISQEHGIIKVNNKEFFEEINIGDIVYIIPVHSCLTANLITNFKTLAGEEIQVICK